ncbi:MAG: hypothetical protein CL431_08595 [Acidimicrobiaceae bacterium]|nr:hypothetical protein [Acidimicrobiaceae bacterium]
MHLRSWDLRNRSTIKVINRCDYHFHDFCCSYNRISSFDFRRQIMKDPKRNLIGLVFGAMFGGVLAAGSLHEYDTIHNMLRLDKFYVFGFMGSAIAIATLGLGILESRNTKTSLGGIISLQRSDINASHIRGGVIFGSGWAIAGTCPAPVLVMLSSGAMLSLVVIAGIFVGLAIADSKGSSTFGDGEHRITEDESLVV